MSDTYESRLFEILKTKFNVSELQVFCYDLGIGYEELPGDNTITNKAMELLAYCKRRDRLIELYEAVRRARPNAFVEVWQGSIGQLTEDQVRNGTTEKWVPMAAAASAYLLETIKVIARMRLKQSKLCKRVLQELPDLPEQRRAKIQSIIEDDCHDCKETWPNIQSSIRTGIGLWRDYIQNNCVTQDCTYFTNRLKEAEVTLLDNLRKEFPDQPVELFFF